MKLQYPKEWFERSAEIEGDAEVGAGFPPTTEPHKQDITPLDTRIALGQFVALWRRNRGWNAEKLAAHAGIDTAEVFEIERDPYCSPECSKSRRAAFLKSPVSLKAGHRNCANKPSASPPARNPSRLSLTPRSRHWRLS
jgi:hypothetical protein